VSELILLKEKPWIRVHDADDESRTTRIQLTEQGWEDMKEFLRGENQ
jgi:hypothetical protein